MRLQSLFYERHPWLQQFGLECRKPPQEGLTQLRPSGFQLQPLICLHYLLDGDLHVQAARLDIAGPLWAHPWKFFLARQVCARFLHETLGAENLKAHPQLMQQLTPSDVGLAREFRVPPVPWMQQGRLALGKEKLWVVDGRVAVAPAKAQECADCGFPLAPKGKHCALCGKAAAGGNLWSRLGLG
ncbi:MAG: hypothetical protein KF760_11200 [Candidatus Eremiobacteraeota bacterium]|nr:hypothetical protein [Candidatus Eremiobacteraeota bacterium]MCW5870632.1 hypothetical protein [Candidatus Eremiobacteraeota bacterium]